MDKVELRDKNQKVSRSVYFRLALLHRLGMAFLSLLFVGAANAAGESSASLVYSKGNDSLTLAWPVEAGWTLQAQTNSLGVGLAATWFDVPESAVTNQLTARLDPSHGSVFYRLFNPVSWTPIPKSDPASMLFDRVKAAQPSSTSLPDNSTYNYIWAQNMMAWMVAERSGLMTTEECSSRLSGLLNRVAGWQNYHGFYYDSYNPSTGAPTSDNVYFQGWWIWALILVKEAYPDAAAPASTILSRIDYDAAGMVSVDHQFLVADRNTRTGAISYNIQPTGDIAGELRTPLICYTWLTGDITPWKVAKPFTFIDVGGQSTLSVWHHFTFDPFYVHSCFPEFGYFQKSYENLVIGANAHRAQNGMRFYATRMEPLEAWTTTPTNWPNTEHRVAKPWTAWLTDTNAPVMDQAWISGYGLAQYFDHWNFYWGYGTVRNEHAKKIGGPEHGVFQAAFTLETLPSNVAAKPPRLTQVQLLVKSDPEAAPLIVKVNGIEVGRVTNSASLTTPITIVPVNPPVLGANNTLRLETVGTNFWRIGAPPTTYQSVRWSDDTHAATNVSAIGLTIFVEGQRASRENPYAFLCRAAGAFGNFPWKLLAEKAPARFGAGLVAWIGNYTTDVSYAHVIYNVETTAKTVNYSLSPWETAQQWAIVDYDHPGTSVASTRDGDTLHWTQKGRQTIRIIPR